jgi:hypothetical protein
MNILNFSIIDNFLENPNEHLSDINSGVFEDIDTNIGLFKGIQLRDDIVSFMVRSLFPDYIISMNFARRSPLNQIEPTFVHSDAGMGDLTCVLYLSKDHPREDGTTIYNTDDPEDKSLTVYSRFNRMIVFDSKLFHSRNIFSNFGFDDTARLVQVLFLKK